MLQFETMMFDELTKNLIISGRKTVTRRLRKDHRRPAIPNTIHKIKIDRTPKIYGLIYILSCEKGYLGNLSSLDAINEGFDTRNEYLEYFKKVNGTNAYNTPIWIITFKYLSKK